MTSLIWAATMKHSRRKHITPRTKCGRLTITLFPRWLLSSIRKLTYLDSNGPTFLDMSVPQVKARDETTLNVACFKYLWPISIPLGGLEEN